MYSGVPYSTQLNADPGRSSSLKTLLWGTQATDSCPEALGIAYQTLPEVVSGLQACKYRPDRALASRRAEGRGQADAPPWKPCQQVSVLCERKSPAPCLPTSSSPALSLGWRWAVSRFSGGWGGGGLRHKHGERPRGARPLPSQCVTWKGDPSPGGASARRSVSPSPGPSPSPPASPPRPLLHVPPQPPRPRQLLVSPAPARHFRLCVRRRVRTRAAPPPRRPPASGGGGAVTSRAGAFSSGALDRSRWGGPAVPGVSYYAR